MSIIFIMKCMCKRNAETNLIYYIIYVWYYITHHKWSDYIHILWTWISMKIWAFILRFYLKWFEAIRLKYNNITLLLYKRGPFKQNIYLCKIWAQFFFKGNETKIWIETHHPEFSTSKYFDSVSLEG